jgi:hypothetical protein
MTPLDKVYNKPFKLGMPGFVNARGTNGTGKSTIIRKYLTPGAKLMYFEDIGCHFYDCGTHFIVGKYESACGGLDGVRGLDADKAPDGQTIMPYEAGQRAIMRLSHQKTTFGEGLIYGTTFKGSQEVYEHLKGMDVPYFWFSIDISPEEVFRSVLERRVKNGNKEPLPTANVAAKFRPVLASHNKASELGVWTFCGDREEVANNIALLLEGKEPTKPLGQKFDLEKAKADMKVWTDKEFVSPTPEMIEQHFPKPTTNSLAGFFL